MATIEERAKKVACGSCNICDSEPQPCGGNQYSTYKILTQFATEQDRIARKEERERCIKAVKNSSCALYCLNYEDEDRCRVTNCITKSIIRAIEEGGK